MGAYLVVAVRRTRWRPSLLTAYLSGLPPPQRAHSESLLRRACDVVPSPCMVSLPSVFSAFVEAVEAELYHAASANALEAKEHFFAPFHARVIRDATSRIANASS